LFNPNTFDVQLAFGGSVNERFTLQHCGVIAHGLQSSKVPSVTVV